MSAAMLTADWFLLGRDLYFRKFELYSMAWHQDINLENLLVCSAPYSGPIAIRRDDRKFVKVQGTGQPVITIFSSAGKQIATFKWTRRPIVSMGWTNSEKLVCVQEDGMVVIHDMFGKFQHTFSIYQKLQDAKIIDVKFFTSMQNFTGIAVLTSNFKIFVIHNILDPKTRPLLDLPKSKASAFATSWAIVAEDARTDVFILRGHELYRINQDDDTSQILEPEFTNGYTLILEIATSFNGRHIAFFTDSGYLWLGSSNLRVKYCEIDTETVLKPKQLVWCGNESVALFWEATCTLMIVGKHGKLMTYTYDSSVHLVQEIDGVRIISNTQHELLQKVPDVVQKIFRINSTDPGSFLLEASKQFQRGSHKANEYISLVKGDLRIAVEECIDAVGYEFDTDVQKMLIRAAQFGKCFIENMDSTNYVKMCRLLRVLNAVRDPKIGIPLTITQLHCLTPKVLLDRLITRNNYFLALEIAKYLKLPPLDGTSHILVHWAKYKVSQSQLEEETVARKIADNLGTNSGISYSEIAKTASDCGKKKLAIKLLDYEAKASEKVQLLLQLGENTPALVKAIESGDTDLIYMVILQLREKLDLGGFKLAIRNFPVAHALYLKYCKQHNPQASNEMYIQEDDFSAQGEKCIMESLDKNKRQMQDSFLTAATEAYKKGRKDLYASMCEDSLRLLKLQRDLEEKLAQPNKFADKSVHDTCRILLTLKDAKVVEKFRSDFKIPEKRFWWLKIESLAEQDEWGELEKFSKLKKSPIGYAPFVDVCLDKKKEAEALKYLPKVAEDLKVKYYVKAGFLENASDIAFQQRDVQSLLLVQSKCVGEPRLLERINAMVAQLERK